MHFTIFYAWQSDRPEKVNKYLIKSAVEGALKNIKADAEVDLAPELDHDTKGVPGIPDIPSTICQKIDRCGIFLADMTFSGTTVPVDPARKPKYLPNPNVLIELGYAMARLGPSRIIYVMNTAFGGPEELPFDIRVRRHPIAYELLDAVGPTRADVQRSLTGRLEEAIRAIVASGALKVRDEEPTMESLQAARLRAEMAIAASIRQEPGTGTVDGAHIVDFAVRNLGERPLQIGTVTATWRYSEEFVRAIGKWPNSITPPDCPRDARTVLRVDGAQPGQDAFVRVLVQPPPEEGVFFARNAATQRLPLAQVHLTVRCKNLAGQEKDVFGSGTLM